MRIITSRIRQLDFILLVEKYSRKRTLRLQEINQEKGVTFEERFNSQALKARFKIIGVQIILSVET
jgi:hypothetical protein